MIYGTLQSARVDDRTLSPLQKIDYGRFRLYVQFIGLIDHSLQCNCLWHRAEINNYTLN